MRVKLCANWSTSEQVTNRLLRQFSPNNEKNIEFVYDNSYDVIIFFNYPNEPVKNGAKVIILPQEPYWSGSHYKNPCNMTNVTYYGYDINNYECKDKIKESVAMTFYGGRGEWVDDPLIWNYDNIMSSVNIPKNKMISSCVSTLNSNNGVDCTYNLRFNIIKDLIESDARIDFFGGWDLYYSKDNVKNSPYKIDSVKDYKFTLAIENSYSKNWITEKFYDAVLFDCIPIYYGCNNISEIFPYHGAFIELKNINDIQPLVKHLSEYGDTVYDQLLPMLKQLKNDYLTKNNLYHRIVSIIN